MQAGSGRQPLGTVCVYVSLGVELAYLRTANATAPMGPSPASALQPVSDRPYCARRHGNSREQVEAAKGFNLERAVDRFRALANA
jgi:imidazoleglycerol phosphate dehydratase HisB